MWNNHRVVRVRENGSRVGDRIGDRIRVPGLERVMPSGGDCPNWSIRDFRGCRTRSALPGPVARRMQSLISARSRVANWNAHKWCVSRIIGCPELERS
jgi:hypothetical protein